MNTDLSDLPWLLCFIGFNLCNLRTWQSERNVRR